MMAQNIGQHAIVKIGLSSFPGLYDVTFMKDNLQGM